MPTLRELQAGVVAALLLGDRAAEAWIEAGDLAPATRLDVHRNTVLASLADTLAARFPVVQRLVDPRFFAYAATGFVRARPPRQPSLAEYGADFADFLAGFEPCQPLAYLADVARLEWTIGRVARAVACPPLAPQALGRFSDDEAERLIFEFQPTIALIASRFPIDAIWRANQPNADDAAVDLADGPVRVEVHAHGGGIVLRRLDHATFAFHAALAAGETLRVAADAALVIDPEFALGRVLADLFHDGAVVAAKPAIRKETSP